MPRRRWFQFHLSTLVLLTLVAGVLMWLNFRPRERWMAVQIGLLVGVHTFPVDESQLEFAFLAQKKIDYGWPVTCYEGRRHRMGPPPPLSLPPAMTAQQREELNQLPTHSEHDMEYLRAAAPSLVDRVVYESEVTDDQREPLFAWIWSPLALNLLVAVALLVGAGLGCEFVTRRRMKVRDDGITN